MECFSDVFRNPILQHFITPSPCFLNFSDPNFGIRTAEKALPRAEATVMINREKKFLLFMLTTSFLATVNSTQAQQARKVLHIGFPDAALLRLGGFSWRLSSLRQFDI